MKPNIATQQVAEIVQQIDNSSEAERDQLLTDFLSTAWPTMEGQSQ